MKKILAVLIAALMICLSVVPAMAVFPVGDALYFVGQCIELYNTSAQIHEAYADTIQKAICKYTRLPSDGTSLISSCGILPIR